MKVTFQLATEDLTATVAVENGATHPDLLDELGRRCVRLFVEGNASLEFDDPAAGEGGEA